MSETHLVSTNNEESGGFNIDTVKTDKRKRSGKHRPLSAIFLGCFVSDKLEDGVSTIHQTKSEESINVTSGGDTEPCVSPTESTTFSESLDKYRRERRFSLSRSLQSLRKKTSPEKLEAKSDENEKTQGDDAYGFVSPLRNKLHITPEDDQGQNRDFSLPCSSENPTVTLSTEHLLSQKLNEIPFVNIGGNLTTVLDGSSFPTNHACTNGLQTGPAELEVIAVHAPRLRQPKISKRAKQRPRSLGDLDKKVTKRWSLGTSPEVDYYCIKGGKSDKAFKRKSLDVSRNQQRRGYLSSPMSEEAGHNQYTLWPPYKAAITRATSIIANIHHGLSSAFEERNSDDEGSIYRRGARRWRKLYKVNGHIFQAKRFNRRASCEFCKDRIWGLGRQGFKCTQCKLLVHKKCHKLQKVPCNADLDTSTDTLASHDSSTLTRIGTNGRMPVSEYIGEVSDPGITEETPVEMPSSTGTSSEPMTPTGQAGQYCLEDFELIRVIGRGSYAKVLMVELKKTNRIYAMKVIKKTLVTDDEDIDWVQTEKHVFETASNHPFLVGLHSCFQTPSRLFFVIEFVRGGDLMFHMQRQRRLPEEHARFYAAEICLALNFLHEKGIIYRDLKLDNVLLDHEGHIKLTDYGMCKEGIRPGDTTSTFCGTPNYIAPEILQGVEYSFSVDWWALGVLLYEMLAGKSPFDIVGASDNPDCNTEDFLFQVILERPIRIPRSLSVKAASILKGFLNKNPVDRLGCHPETGFTDIVTHPFFKTIDWEMLEQRQVPPPYRPRLDSERDLANFPPEFTDEPIQLTLDDPRAIENIDQSEFEGFEYVNPLLMSMEDCV